ncbi:hypothetical protein A7975_03690 [Bacillus sp. FJAT-26390]|nr:hypothetical protein A7975_03690 [Bacillus sp. FJAT-26390]
MMHRAKEWLVQACNAIRYAIIFNQFYNFKSEGLFTLNGKAGFAGCRKENNSILNKDASRGCFVTICWRNVGV